MTFDYAKQCDELVAELEEHKLLISTLEHDLRVSLRVLTNIKHLGVGNARHMAAEALDNFITITGKDSADNEKGGKDQLS